MLKYFIILLLILPIGNALSLDCEHYFDETSTERYLTDEVDQRLEQQAENEGKSFETTAERCEKEKQEEITDSKNREKKSKNKFITSISILLIFFFGVTGSLFRTYASIKYPFGRMKYMKYIRDNKIGFVTVQKELEKSTNPEVIAWTKLWILSWKFLGLMALIVFVWLIYLFVSGQLLP